MATVSPADVDGGSAEHSVWMKAFTPEQRQELIEEDLFAGTSVAIELGCVLLMGALLGAFTVFMVR